MSGGLLWILGVIQAVDPLLRIILAGIAILLETSLFVGLVVPGDTIVVVAATGVTNPVEYILLVVTVIIGALCGESIGFILGRFFGPKIRASRLGRRLGEVHWIRAERYIDRRGGIAVFVSRFLPVLHALVPVTVGMSSMSYRRFMVWTIPASVIWSCAYVSVGALAVGSFTALLDSLHSAGYLFVGIILLGTIIMLWGKKVLARREERHMNQLNEVETSE
ncbi:MAG: DedA family protein [Rhodoglobus sp.]